MKNILTTILISLFAATVAVSHAYAQSAPDSAQSATVSATTVAEKKAPLYQLSSAAEPARRDTVSLTIAQIQGMRETATQLMGTYEKALQNIAKPESQQEFKSLFAPGAQLYNDLFGLDFSESLSLDNYVAILTAHAHDYKVALDNVDVSVVPNDSIYRVFVSCRKNTECRNDCGVQLISKDYYIYGYALTLEFVFPSPEAKPLITKITGDAGKNIPLLEQNFCIINAPKSFRRLWVNGQRPNYSARGQYYASSSVSVHIDDPHVKVRTSADTR
ncbi:MAG: hypothetical protein HUK08_09815, partial [Bacteroidaceae bacterium]|nr:hypothetical protein [Bacteroidaceae bacterium]